MKELKKLLEFYNLLQDGESKRIFEVKLKMLVKKSKYSDFIDELISLNKEWKVANYDDFREAYKGKPIIIFGAGSEGKLTLHILRKMGIDIAGFCDNDSRKWGENTFEGKPVFSPTDIVYNHREKFVILASMNYSDKFYHQLTSALNPFPRENIWMPRIGSLYASTGKQYFDCPNLEVESDEVFIDAGCFDGGTSKDFIKWCDNNYKKIIAFEPDQQCFRLCRKLELDNFHVINVATWNKKEKLNFNMTSDGGSSNNKYGSIEIEGNTIDNILAGEAATFIKLDVEGAEYNTILGASETIMKHKPKLAISIYHKEEDIYEIPLLLMRLRDDYKFYIRHYTSSPWETVLYAI